MRNLILFIILLIFPYNIFSQRHKQISVSLIKTHIFNVDSVTDLNNLKSYPILKESRISSTNLSTPEQTVQEYFSFNTKNWGQKLLSNEYSETFLSTKLIDLRNSEEYKNNAFLKIYFTFFFKDDSTLYAGCLTEGYFQKDLPRLFSIQFLKLVNGKWLYVYNKFTNEIQRLSILKPQYAYNLLLGKKIVKNAKFNELLNKVYKNNTIDIKLLDSLLIERDIFIEKSIKEEYYSELINKKSFTYFITHPLMK